MGEAKLGQSFRFLKREFLEDNSVQIYNFEVIKFAAETTRETNLSANPQSLKQGLAVPA